MWTKEEVRNRIAAIGILPAIRARSAEDALFAAHEMVLAGIQVVELTMTVPDAINLIRQLQNETPGLMVGAGTVLSVETAERCTDAGVAFITSPGFNAQIADFAVRHNVTSIPGALTPSEIMMARDSGADLVKVFPCSQVGGPSYIRAMRAPFPDVPFIAAGGVDQTTTADFLRAGAIALGIREQLIPPEAVERRDHNWIAELASRFLRTVEGTRAEFQLPRTLDRPGNAAS